MLPITSMLLTNHNRPGKKIIKIKGIAIHWTANEKIGADAKANRNYFNNTDRACSAHYIVDDHSIIQCVENAGLAYHVGSSKYTPFGQQFKPTPNFYFIGIEICVNKDGNFNKAYQNAVELTAYLVKEYGLTINDIVTHHMITGKDCPRFMQKPEEVNAFRMAVSKVLNSINKEGEIDIMSYNLKPICQGRLKGTGGLECCSQPSNSARTGVILKKIHEPFNIYTKVYNEEEGNYWYLVNKNLNCIQWVAAGYVEFI